MPKMPNLMEVKHTNGNHLNWERLEGVEMICLDCFEQRLDDGYYDMNSEQQEEYNEQHEDTCDGHTHMYFEHQTISQEPFETTLSKFETWMINNHKGYTQPFIDSFIDWYILHDTNGNFVTVYGEYPKEVLVGEED